MRKLWIILVLAAAVINLPCAHASFTTTSATATVIDPPAGTSYYAGSYLVSHTSHTITVKKVDNNPPFGFYVKGTNGDNCSNTHHYWAGGAYGLDWSVGEEHPIAIPNVEHTAYLGQAGAFQVVGTTCSKQVKEPYQAFITEAMDSHPFTVQ